MWVSKKKFEELVERINRAERDINTIVAFDSNLGQLVKDIESYLGIEHVSEPPRYQKRKSQGKGR